MNRICEISRKGRHRQRERTISSSDIYHGGLSYRRENASTAVSVIFVIISISSTLAFSLNSRHGMIRTIPLRIEAPHTHAPIVSTKLSNVSILHEGKNPDRDEIMQAASPIEPLPSSQYVQQEQLLEVISRIGADTIATLSISERTKRAMLAEAVEDEIFSCTEQIIDLVNEQLEYDVNNDNSNQSALNTRQKSDIKSEIVDLQERNQFLQSQYNDLVSGRPSSLLNTVNSVGASTAFDGLNYPIDDVDGTSKADSDGADFTQFN